MSHRKIDLRWADALLGKVASCFYLVSCSIGGQLLWWGGRICSDGSMFIPLGVDPILKGLYCPGKHRGSLMGCFPLWN